MFCRASLISPTALLLGAVALLGQALPVPAHAGKRVALVIGNAAYQEAPLRNPVNDARAMSTMLEHLGFEVISVENGDRETMERAIIDFTRRLDEGSSGLFYYAGHGIQVRGGNYLVPVNARIASEQEARIEAVSINLVLDELEYAGSRINIVILDACRNNPFERRLRGGGRGLAAVDAARGTIIAYATAPGSVAEDGDGSNGLYTEELLSALARPGLNVEQMFKRVRVSVSKRTGNRQIPWESSSLTGEFVFNQKVPKPAEENPAEYVYWQSVEKSGTPEAYRAYLEQFPDGVFETLALIRIEEVGGVGMPSSAADEESKAWGRIDESTTRGMMEVGIFQPAGKFRYSCDHHFDPATTAKSLRRHLFVKPLYSVDTLYYSKLAASYMPTSEELWRPDGLRKSPDFERIYVSARELGLEQVWLFWYQVVTVSCIRAELQLYLVDVTLEKTYQIGGVAAQIDSMADSLVAQFDKGRAMAKSTP